MSPWGGVEPRAWQRGALAAAREAAPTTHRDIIEACTGSGKSRLIGAIAACTPGPVLITTPTQALTEQLATTLDQHCPGEVGRAYQHAWETDRRVVVTCAASLRRLLAERPTWRRWICDEAHLRLPVEPDAPGIGVSATPFAGTRGAGVWKRVLYRYPASQAVADGALVEHRTVRVEPGTPVATPEEREAVCRAWVASWDGPGVVSASCCDDADAFAASTPGVAAVHQGVHPDDRRERIEALRTGALRGLVQVRMLREGVDLPWLRNVLLRVPVSSPASLVQYVGRGLRAAPGKTECVVYDPYDLLGAIGLTHTAAIDQVLAEAPEETAEQWDIPELQGLDGLQGLPEFVVVHRLEAWVSDLYAALQARGPGVGVHLRQRPVEQDRTWRALRATPEQRKRMSGLVGRAVGRLPEAYRSAFRWLLEREDLRRGTAADATDVLVAVWERFEAVRKSTGRPYWKLSASIVPNVPECTP